MREYPNEISKSILYIPLIVLLFIKFAISNTIQICELYLFSWKMTWNINVKPFSFFVHMYYLGRTTKRYYLAGFSMSAFKNRYQSQIHLSFVEHFSKTRVCNKYLTCLCTSWHKHLSVHKLSICLKTANCHFIVIPFEAILFTNTARFDNTLWRLFRR